MTHNDSVKVLNAILAGHAFENALVQITRTPFYRHRLKQNTNQALQQLDGFVEHGIQTLFNGNEKEAIDCLNMKIELVKQLVTVPPDMYGPIGAVAHWINTGNQLRLSQLAAIALAAENDINHG